MPHKVISRNADAKQLTADPTSAHLSNKTITLRQLNQHKSPDIHDFDVPGYNPRYPGSAHSPKALIPLANMISVPMENRGFFDLRVLY